MADLQNTPGDRGVSKRLHSAQAKNPVLPQNHRKREKARKSEKIAESGKKRENHRLTFSRLEARKSEKKRENCRKREKARKSPPDIFAPRFARVVGLDRGSTAYRPRIDRVSTSFFRARNRVK